jgi:hypothetical protein
MCKSLQDVRSIVSAGCGRFMFVSACDAKGKIGRAHHELGVVIELDTCLCRMDTPDLSQSGSVRLSFGAQGVGID